jgi:hypothetical protein
MKFALKLVCTVAAAWAAGCNDYESATDLHPEGPPMIQQVRLVENVRANGTSIQRTVFGFGTHPEATESEMHPVTSAASIRPQKLRVIIDELLVGNYIEEINCREIVDDDAYDRVPVGATPDDVANCAVAQDVLAVRCTGDGAMCICKLPGGCGPDLIPEGSPVGIADVNQDGGADDTRMIAGAVGIRCNGMDVPIDLDMSYWNPSGNQQKPADGFDLLGPAIILVPLNGLPTSSTCQLTLSPEIVDKQDIQVCAPPNGDITQDCTPGDVSAFTFSVEPLIIAETGTPRQGQTGVSRTSMVRLASLTQDLDVATLTNITMTENGAPYTSFTVMYMNKVITLTSTAVGGWTGGATYVVTVPITVTDVFGQPLPAPFTLTFTTAP